jgi:subtilisin family serine protease
MSKHHINYTSARSLSRLPSTLRTTLTLAIMVSLSRTAFAEPAMVIADRYIIQRKLQGESKPSQPSPQATYVIEDGGKFFDVVITKSSAAQSSDRRPVELDWSKVTADCQEIRKDPDVISCDPEGVSTLASTPNDPMYSSQWAVHDPANNADADVPEAWVRGTGDRSVVVGVIDSGIHYQHPDLYDNVWRNAADPVDGFDNDGNGYVDDYIGINATQGTNNPSDCTGHGTHVSGIIGATGNNGVGIVGVNWAVSLAAASVGDGGCGPSLSDSGILRAMEYFYDLKLRGHNIRLINGSYRSPIYSQAAFDAMVRLNSVDILFVAAAGNDAVNLDVQPRYPANYDVPNVIAVGATGPDFKLAQYSNFGESVDIAAPGGNLQLTNGGVLSTYSPLAPGNAEYASMDGTSMAAPMVAGAIALVASQNPNLSGSQLKELLLSSAWRLSHFSGKVNGGRFLNVGGMSEAAADPSDDSCPNDPNKTRPGICGCGVSDTDSDGDGTPDCNDACSADPGKTSPGVCGCGVGDIDANGNGQIDCVDSGNGSGDSGLKSIVPPRPTIRRQGRWLRIDMQQRGGVDYYVELQFTPPRRSNGRRLQPEIKILTWQSNAFLIRRPPKRYVLQVRYAFRTLGTESDFSYYSYPTRHTVR